MEGINIVWKFWMQDVFVNLLIFNLLNICDKFFFDFCDFLVCFKESGLYVFGNFCDFFWFILVEVFFIYVQQLLFVWSNFCWNFFIWVVVFGWNEYGDLKSFYLEEFDCLVEGEFFDGYFSLAGIFYQGEVFLEEFYGKYIYFDFSGWICMLDIDDSNNFSYVDFFYEYMQDIIYLIENVKEGVLYYMNFVGQIWKISFGGNFVLVVVIEVDCFFGLGLLEVQFFVVSFYDLNVIVMIYEWNFGDGIIVIGIEFIYMFNVGGNMFISFEVKFIVIDVEGVQSIVIWIVLFNNILLQVVISSFKDGD